MTQLRLKQLNNINIPKSVVEGIITSCSYRGFRYYFHSNKVKAELACRCLFVFAIGSHVFPEGGALSCPFRPSFSFPVRFYLAVLFVERHDVMRACSSNFKTGSPAASAARFKSL